MSMVKIEKKGFDGQAYDPDAPEYPYGTRLDFQDELVDRLDLDRYDVGDVVEVRAIAFVRHKSEHKTESTEGNNHSGKCVELQLTEVRVDKERPDRIETLYGQ